MVFVSNTNTAVRIHSFVTELRRSENRFVFCIRISFFEFFL